MDYELLAIPGTKHNANPEILHSELLSVRLLQTCMMTDFLKITDFLDPVDIHLLSNDEVYKEGQIGNNMAIFTKVFPDIDQAAIILVGCNEVRGHGASRKNNHAPDAIRCQFYKLFHYHMDIKLADIGNIKQGITLSDTYAALKTVVSELVNCGKTVIILGGSHDLTLAQYHAYADSKNIIEMACVDSRMDLSIEMQEPSEKFLMQILTGEPNYIRHYNHIGFQSYYVHPRILETMDKLRFDCYRLGNVRENIEEMEPVIRNCQLFSFDISAIAHAFAPANSESPNGFDGEQACVLMRYAGLSANVNTIGIYGYFPEEDRNNLTAKQISQMLWYLLDGKSRGMREAMLEDKDAFLEFTTAFTEVNTVFLQSKKTGRWWMQLPDHTFIACSYKDYQLASSNEIPERWLRAQERS
ncbi:MAG: formimidoylglutamase [Chitinophagaceae bacterium]